MKHEVDTIAAIATPAGAGAIGILRLSGDRAVEIASTCFRPLGKVPFLERKERTLVYGDLLDQEGEVIDRVLCTYTRAPLTYTGEDTAEIHCHGSQAVLALGLEALFAQGARPAKAGEFTQRAFLNGRLDLAQAEAVADLLEARSREGARQAAGQLCGALSQRIEHIYNALVDIMAHFHAVLDYPEEDIAPFTMTELEQQLLAQEKELNQLLQTYERGRQINQGVQCVLVGRPNAGKSSLLNALVGYERAIVTDIPGTTRDTIEEQIQLGGVPLRMIDTAGLRNSHDPIEQMGVERSREAMHRAELILVLWDSSAGVNEEDLALLKEAMQLAPTILVWTKKDLNQLELPVLSIEQTIPTVELSAKTGEGMEQLAQVVAAQFPKQTGGGYGAVLTNVRQAQAAQSALESVRRSREALLAGMTPDALLTDVEQALEALGQLTGQTVSEDVTARIFARFCVGK